MTDDAAILRSAAAILKGLIPRATHRLHTGPPVTASWMWYACEQPERPPDACVMWHYHDCDGCRFKAEVQVARFPDDQHVRWLLGVMVGNQ